MQPLFSLPASPVLSWGSACLIIKSVYFWYFKRLIQDDISDILSIVYICDISKSFDRIWHRLLLHTLSGKGCSDKLTSWFFSYMSGRKQRFVLSGQVSGWMSVLSGVRLDSILGPSLCLIYVNDIFKNQDCSMTILVLNIIVEYPNGAAHSLNIDLKPISTCADAWLVALNTVKTVSMIFSREANAPQHPPLLMNNFLLPETETHKHLGLTFSKTCTRSDHIQAIHTKAWSRII